MQTTVTSGGKTSSTQHLPPHPDADQLNAFAERSLPEHERLETLEHLAGCAECREILALSLPPVEENAVLAAEPDEVPAARPFASWFAGWKLVWIAAPALAALILLTVHLKNAISGPPLAAKPGQVADAHPPAASAPKMTPAPVVPPAKALAATPKTPVRPSVPAPAPTPAPPPAMRAPDTAKLKAAPAAPVARSSETYNGTAAIERGRALDSQRLRATPPAAAASATRAQSAAPRLPLALPSPRPALAPDRLKAKTAATAAPVPKPDENSGTIAGSGAVVYAAPASSSVFNLAGAAIAGEEVPEATADVSRNRYVDASNQAILPSGVAVLSLAANLHQRVAIDARNQLFFSRDDGQHWRAVPAPWKGHAITVANILPAPAVATPRSPVLAFAVPERYTPGASATVESGEAGATLSGAVTDATGAAIPGATVVATDNRTALTRTVETDAQGRYLVDELPPGVYRIEARAPGFAAQSQIAALGEVQQSLNTIRLAIGQSAQTVTVEAAATAQLETSSRIAGSSAGKTRMTGTTLANKAASANRPLPLFLLTTDSGDRWTSSDGTTWSRE